RLEKSSLDNNLSMILSKIIKTVMMVLAVLIALPLVGIDLTVLSVFGGALGVGIGFGLQKVASNYISGFIILGDRSI
ncbi:mechanosensitive ion channel, partial [Klebsiella pneumoniae]|nr:mechanosensitive ion channel [Klebsiella pneumoniae]